MNSFNSDVKTLLSMCMELGSPRAMCVYNLARNQEWNQLINLQVLPEHSAEDRLVTLLLSKHQDMPLGIDKERVALESFEKSEAKCKLTNAFFADPANRSHPMIHKIRKIISRILGPVSRKLLDGVSHDFRFGPGATSACKGSHVNPADKYACDMHLTPRLRPFALSVMGPTWYSTPHGGVYVLDTSELTTVRKNAKTDRCICIEPHGNVLVQLGIGRAIRKALRRAGINLDTGQDWNRLLAQLAFEERLATIDLKAASDTIAHAVVKMLLPSDWYALLFLARTDFTSNNGKRTRLEKFSSMGNGYTFELETLIFFATALACGSPKLRTAVYGDDIIVPQEHSATVIDTLTFLGFEVNTEKTFVEGNFYESCGTDWLNGHAVRPFHLKGDYHDQSARDFFVCNSIARWCSTSRLGVVSDDPAHRYRVRFSNTWRNCYASASKLAKRTAIPDGVGDSGFVRTLVSAIEHDAVHDAPNGLGGFIGTHRPLAPKLNPWASETGRLLATLSRGSYEPRFVLEEAVEPLRPAFRKSGKDEVEVVGLRDLHTWEWRGVEA